MKLYASTLKQTGTARFDWRALSHKLWSSDLQFGSTRGGLVLMAMLVAGALLSETGVHYGLFELGALLRAKTVVAFANVRELLLSELDAVVASWLVIGIGARVLFGVAAAVLDMLFYRKITGRRFDWEGMVNLAVVNVIFLCTALLTFMNASFQVPLRWYESLISRVPTLLELDGNLAVIAACLAGDLCFYWSHRLCHKVRLFWNLGHINHHRARDMSQLTHSVDPHALFLDTAGGKVFVLLFLPLATKLFTADLSGSGWALVAVMAIDVWLNPSHSVFLYQAEIRLRVLRWFRWLLVTPAVHYTHHSREPRHNISDGANFAARFSLWDRLFGTYVEPPAYIPETGLYGEQVDYCRNPLRFVLLPYVKLYRELRDHELKYWPAILFGPTSWQPRPRAKAQGQHGDELRGARAAAPGARLRPGLAQPRGAHTSMPAAAGTVIAAEEVACAIQSSRGSEGHASVSV